MCGLFGFIGNGLPPDADYLHHVAQLAERRGPHAFGFFCFSQERRWGRRLPNPYSQVKNELDAAADARAVIGHCRLSTSGGRYTATDAQPILYGDTVIAHNGTVPDYAAIAEKNQIDLNTNCDSELLAALIDRTPGDLSNAVSNASECMPGLPYVILGFKAGTLFAARRGHPLYRIDRSEGVYLCSIDPGGGIQLEEKSLIFFDVFSH